MKRRNFLWLLTAVLSAILLLLFVLGRWRSGGTGAQVQVPMFYDDHYVYPRPWTQAQETPGIPAPAPLAFYGDNRISQTFVAGSDRLSMIEIWLQGSPYAAVEIALQDDAGNAYTGTAFLPEQPDGKYYRFTFPPIADAHGREFHLILSAAGTTVEQPALTHTIGGDRLNGGMQLNEYGRPGNIELQTYVQGGLFHWPLQAIGQQILPDPFRLRLQQYKPIPLKGAIFSILLGLTAVLSTIFLFLAAPSTTRAAGRTAGWGVSLCLLTFLSWQTLTGRVQLPLPFTTSNLTAVVAQSAPIAIDQPRLTHDLITALWTTERFPEKRFFDTLITDEGYPAIHTPPDSTIQYAMTMPPNGRLHVGGVADGVGQTWFTLLWNDAEIGRHLIDGDAGWFNIDLAPWAGQEGVLSLQTKTANGHPNGRWLMPQISATTDWLLADLPADAQPDGHHFNQAVELVGHQMEEDGIMLYWRGKRPFLEDAVIFVHVIDGNGELVGQHDGRPVGNSYPIPIWPAELIIADFHPLQLPTATYHIEVGLYDQTTGNRWLAVNPDGQAAPDNSIKLDSGSR